VRRDLSTNIDDGAVSGTLSFNDGTTVSVVGNFSATLDANQHLQGGYVVFTTSGSWTVRAEKKPAPGDSDRQPWPRREYPVGPYRARHSAAPQQTTARC